jgi:hypothetical protein
MTAFRRAGATIAISATTTTAASAITAEATNVRVTNMGSVATHVAFGNATLSATTADLVIGPNESTVLFKGNASYVAARTATGTATLYVTPGEGG